MDSIAFCSITTGNFEHAIRQVFKKPNIVIVELHTIQLFLGNLINM